MHVIEATYRIRIHEDAGTCEKQNTENAGTVRVTITKFINLYKISFEAVSFSTKFYM